MMPLVLRTRGINRIRAPEWRCVNNYKKSGKLLRIFYAKPRSNPRFPFFFRVSQYRLAAHLGSAFVIYGSMLWVALNLIRPKMTTWPTLLPLRLLPIFASYNTALL